MSFIAIWVGKVLSFALRLFGRRATSLPGKAALRVCPSLLRRLSRQLEWCVVVTGTNGKTTTSAMLASILRQGQPIIHNQEGANLPQGLTTALLQHTSWRGRLLRRVALFEIDEATLPQVTAALPVQVLVVTNVFRDQLDRYGELDTTLDKLRAGIAGTDAVLVVNGDDPLSRHLAESSGHTVRYFGLAAEHAKDTEHGQTRDGAFCLRCGERLDYEAFFYGQLGLYRCPACGFHRPQPDFTGEIRGWSLRVREVGQPPSEVTLRTRGVFNVYNALAAVAAARTCDQSADHIAAGLTAFAPPLGRMQGYATHPPAVLNLIKNPTGCDSVLQAIVSEPGRKVLCIAINDLAADGRDVSWLWDADFDVLAGRADIVGCVTSGLRAEDMALRMKYAGFTGSMVVQPDLGAALDAALALSNSGPPSADDPTSTDVTVYVLSTYTALYAVAELLKGREHLHGAALAYRTSVS